jgi:hypothetical protein
MIFQCVYSSLLCMGKREAWCKGGQQRDTVIKGLVTLTGLFPDLHVLTIVN